MQNSQVLAVSSICMQIRSRACKKKGFDFTIILPRHRFPTFERYASTNERKTRAESRSFGEILPRFNARSRELFLLSGATSKASRCCRRRLSRSPLSLSSRIGPIAGEDAYGTERDANSPIKLIARRKSAEGSRGRVDHPRSKGDRLAGKFMRASSTCECCYIFSHHVRSTISHLLTFSSDRHKRRGKKSN